MGGMGVVYCARDSRLQRDVAIKMLTAERSLRPASRLRFHREAIAASALNHPNIVTIYEISEHDGADFIVMEYVRGTPLNKLLRVRPLTVDETVRYGIQIADALAKAHQAGVIHRDLKPANIMVTGEGVVKVLDFGLAKFDESQSEPEDPDQTQVASFLTSPGIVTGTMSYMSPEQARGEKVDGRSDIFSLGIVLFELLSQRLPFEGPTLVSMLHNLHFVPPKDLNTLRHDVPLPLLTLISLMLEKEPAHRIQTMGEVAAALRRFSAGKATGLTPRPREVSAANAAVPATQLGSRPALVLGLAAALLLAAGLGVWSYVRMRSGANQAASSTVPDEPIALRRAAAALIGRYYLAGNVGKAATMLERAVQLDPNSAASYAMLGEAYFHKNHANPDAQWMKLARQYSARAVEIDSDLAAGHVSMGLVNMDSKQPAEAEKEFQRAASLDPKNVVPRFYLAALHNDQGKTAEAGEELKRIAADHPDYWPVFMELGLNAYNVSRYNDAAAAWEKALALDPDNVFALQSLSGVYHVLERDDDAADALQKALTIQPDADTYSNLGTIRFYQGRYADAAAAYDKAVSLSANSYANWANLGDAYRQLPGGAVKSKQAYARALQMMREMLTKSPNQTDLRANFAMYLAKSGDKDGAVAELRTLASTKDNSAADQLAEGIAWELAGNRTRALDVLAAAVKAGQNLSDLKNEPELTALRADPRYYLQVLSSSTTPAH